MYMRLCLVFHDRPYQGKLAEGERLGKSKIISAKSGNDRAKESDSATSLHKATLALTKEAWCLASIAIAVACPWWRGLPEQYHGQ